MTKNKKLLIAILIVATIALAVISIVITTAIGNQNLENQTGAQTNPILANCNSATNVCSIPSGVCNPSKVYVHFCNELKRDNEKCISATPVEIPTSPVSSGSSVDLNEYLDSVNCGTVQMYLELENSGVNSLGACGTTVKRFTTACLSGTLSPVSFPSTDTNTNNSGIDTDTNGGTNQLAEPQFIITNTFAPSCEPTGTALLRYTVSVSNNSTVSGTITKIEELIDSRLISNSIVPTNVSNTGTVAGNKITWAESAALRTFSSMQTKTYTYEIRIPTDKLSTFVNGTNSTTTVTYDTSNTVGNTNTFALLSKHTCAIPTANTVVPSNQQPVNTAALPNTSIGDDIKLLILGTLFIILALVFFRFQIGENIVSKILKTTKKE